MYSFGAYSEALKQRLGLSQTQVELAALCANVGNYAGLGGFAVDTFGARRAASFGTVLIGIGYGSLWLLLKFQPLKRHVVAVCACCAVWGHGSGYLDSAAIVTGSKLFPSQRGSVVGLLKSLYGLSSSLVVLCVGRLVGQTTFVGLLALVAVLLPSFNINSLVVVPQTALEDDRRRLASFVNRVFALAICVGVAALVVPADSRAALFVVSVGVAAGLAATTSPRFLYRSTSLSSSSSLPPPNATSAFEEFSPTQALQSVRLWLMLAVVLPVSGCGLMTINNLAQIMAARGAQESTRDAAVALVSVANCLGRLLTGIASDKLISDGGIPRPTLLCVSASLASLSMLVLYSTGTSVHLGLLGVILAGASYGMLWTLIPTLVADFFGLARIGSNYMLCLPAVVLGSVFFSTLLASAVYANAPTDHHDECVGTACFAITFLVTALACALATLSAFILTLKTRHIYFVKRNGDATTPLFVGTVSTGTADAPLLAAS